MTKQKQVKVGEAIWPEWRKRVRANLEHRLVVVYWMDACSGSATRTFSKIQEDAYWLGYIQCSVGWMVKNDKNFVSLIRDIHCEDREQGGSWIDIPAGWVLKIEELKYAKGTRSKATARSKRKI